MDLKICGSHAILMKRLAFKCALLQFVILLLGYLSKRLETGTIGKLIKFESSHGGCSKTCQKPEFYPEFL